MEEEYNGVIFLFSETGTEGGYWSFQDENYISHNEPRGFCKKCGLYLKNINGSYKTKEQLDDIISLLEKEQFSLICDSDKHEEDIGDVWDYKGLYFLKNGDQLVIYSKDKSEIVWEGDINLKEYPLFIEHADGLWIHNDQIGIDRELWSSFFFKNLPSKLIRKRLTNG